MEWGLSGQVALDTIEADFRGLPLAASAHAAIEAAMALGAGHVDVRVSRQRTRSASARDARPLSVVADSLTGLGVRVLLDGVWGFASGDAVTPQAAAEVAALAVAMARVAAPVARERIELAPEPVHAGRVWASPVGIDPFAVPDAEVLALLESRSAQLMGSPHVQRVDAGFHAFRDITYYADSSGTDTLQQRTRVAGDVAAFHVTDERFDDMSSCAPPAARGWEYVVGDGTWDWDAELAALPEWLAEKSLAPSVEPGRYDLVIDPTNLWLTIHESVGHATELDRALGYEANYAGSSFATLDQLGTLRYGSGRMHVTGDRTAPYGLATVGFDDEGVAAQSWDLVRDGTLVGYQLDRRMAAEHGFGRSNGCAFADSAVHVPVQRMPNVSLQPDPSGTDLAGLIAGVEDGIYIVGDKSWSIDMQRYNFQFTGQRFLRIRSGQVVGQVRDVAYQSSTPTFWAGLAALGGPQTYLLGGALNCGKAQPGQVAPVSHGCPVAVFEGINVLNTRQEAHA
ncbi:MAG TPA: TldD/PmbA family protein [Motilibacterales bacterium]|nr:TldD/PmbA family protein [Motilibacterales bacterium]